MRKIPVNLHYVVGSFRQVVRRPSPAHFATSMRSSRFLSAPAAERSSYSVAIGMSAMHLSVRTSDTHKG